jgi:hypothetical protein
MIDWNHMIPSWLALDPPNSQLFMFFHVTPSGFLSDNAKECVCMCDFRKAEWVGELEESPAERLSAYHISLTPEMWDPIFHPLAN